MPRVVTAELLQHDVQICAIAKISRYTRDFTSHRFFRADIENTYRKGEVGVVLSRGKVIGFIYVKHLTLRSRPQSVVHYMGVAENGRGEGVGRALLAWALRTSPHHYVELSCEHSNEVGMKFYEACGLTKVYTGVYGAPPRERPYTRWAMR